MFSANTEAALRGGRWGTLAGFLFLGTQFYMSHWEEYFTGILLMGKWDGPTEGNYFIALKYFHDLFNFLFICLLIFSQLKIFLIILNQTFYH